GIDQLVRSSEATNWRATIDISESQVVPLRRSLRLKSDLCRAVCEAAQLLNVPNWDLQPEPDLFGGRVIVLAGKDYDRAIHSELVSAASATGNESIDMLFCVPPDQVVVDDAGNRVCILAQHLTEWGHKVRDGTSYRIRSDYPTSNKQIRIVLYDTCR